MMYEKFFYLKENPFSITPDPKYLYLSKKHQEALDLLFFGVIEHKGFLMLSGEVGTGKTTLCRALLDKFNSKVKSALILNPLLSDAELIQTINEDFGLKMESSSLKKQIDTLNSFLIEQTKKGSNSAVIIDEAQNLSLKALEMVRLLSNLETEKTKLMQIILVGQPELREKLKLPELRQLNQRIVVRYHLGSLNFEETKAYIFRRLTVAGGKGHIKFTSTALKSIYEASSGIPRLINLVCDRALTAAFVAGTRVIDDEIQKKAIDELDKDGTLKKDADIQPKKRLRKGKYAPYIYASAIIVFIALGLLWNSTKIGIAPTVIATPAIKEVAENTTPQVASDIAGYSAAQKKDVKVQESALLQAELESNIQVEKTSASQDSGEVDTSQAEAKNIISSPEEDVVKNEATFKELVILLNGVEHTIENGKTLEVTKGDKFKIVEAIIDGVSNKEVSVNLLGFVGKRAANTGEDRGYLVDTAKDLWVKYSVKRQGVEYPIVIKHGEKKIGEILIKLKESVGDDKG
ncbi:MAG: hypothetical protein A2X87_03735 [Deltaproteobacteria bacterium GWC2_42_51]|nr:MAG: hypothetical protein A2056_04140 [Deltaproteobacteria bacterium GWA2_42_85]OGP37469.1 MAG: hypothetical protein A2X87_03735 [Deltaproteobacteria bacterium GWC2_42_51]OGP39362.1 MAG: hypothetical protein A2090_10495 [Deltaproteobacteria bacterium GWD2_42_10]OGP47566.1 MAG: hypothetical protein A2022_09220 [Deltaproteobacteria bacterium GWF2_42_12]OGQ24902.1 MAG: hypothetical protein A3D29_00625 [Deltaproteobacteria bacterium RIFCSPHIGHO2_02_FULL_42_44]OGQ37853.1 MAG: hypothetical protei